MSALSDNVFDNGLNYIINNTEKLYLLSDDPGLTWSNIAAYALGSKASPSIGAPANRSGGGREVTVAAINDGNVTGDGTATHYALTKDSNSEIIAAGPLDASQGVSNGNTFTLTAFTVGIPDPA